jgi:DHA3 family macrolide efflux protein-like MFS transporter
VIVGALALRGVGGGIQMPAVTAMIPQLVPEQHLMRFNALAGTMQSAVFIVAPAASAGLLAVLDLGWIFAIDVVTAALAIVGLSLLAVPSLERPAAEPGAPVERPHMGRDLADGVRYAWANRACRRVLLGYTVMFLLVVPPANLSPLVIVRLFDASLVQLSAIEIVWSLGAVVGGVVLAAWGGLRDRMAMMLLVSGAWGVFTVALGLAPTFWVFLVIMTVFGITMPWLSTPATTALQERVAPEYQGRVFGLLSIVMMMSAPVGMLVVGPLADVVSLRSIYVVTGILTVVAAALLSIRAPKLEAPAADDGAPDPGAPAADGEGVPAAEVS